MNRWLSFLTVAFWLFLVGCSSSQKGAIGPVLPPEGMLDELPLVREFQFGVGDEIDILVWRHQNFTQRSIVNPDGYISFALLGRVKVAGLTYSMLNNELYERIGEYVREPRIAINIVRVSDQKVYVLGWVRNPGVYRWNSQMTVVEAIATAGGIIKDTADARSIIIAGGDFEHPELRIVDYLNIVRRGDFRKNVHLQRGDIVYVPKQYVAHADKFFERYANYFRAIREGEFAVIAEPGVEDVFRGDASRRFRYRTDIMKDAR